MKHQFLTAATTMVMALPSASFVLKTSKNPTTHNIKLHGQHKNTNEDSPALRSKYKKDIDALKNMLLDSPEMHKRRLEQMKQLIEDIQLTRREEHAAELALPIMVRDALADYVNAEAKYGGDSREAKVCRIGLPIMPIPFFLSQFVLEI